MNLLWVQGKPVGECGAIGVSASVYICYAKATTAGRRFSEGGTHEETLHPQDQEGDLRENKRLRMTRN